MGADDEPGAKSKRLRMLGLGLAVLLLIGGLAYYIHYSRVGRYIQETNDARIEADQVAISSKLSGYVHAIAVADNQDVAKGTLLVQIDPVDYRNKVSAAEADIASSTAARQASEALQSETLAAVSAAQANLRAAEAMLSFADRELARNTPLAKTGFVTATTLSQLVANRDRATAEVAAQRATVIQAERKVASVGAQTSQFSAQAEAARVQHRSASTDLSFTNLVAPMSGRVANRSVRVGQYVQPGIRLMTIVPKQGLYVLANFKETQVGLIRPGQPATIHADALPDVEFRGTVTSVTPGTGANFSLIPPQNATGNFTKIVQRVPVRIRIEAGPAARRVLVPGLSLEVSIDTRASRAELDAIRAEQER